jgi:hypothetical protein
MKPAIAFEIAASEIIAFEIRIVFKIAAALVIASLALPASAADEAKPPAEKENGFKVVGHDAKTAAHQAAHAAKETGKAIGEGTKKTVKEIGHAMQESAARTKKEAKETFK